MDYSLLLHVQMLWLVTLQLLISDWHTCFTVNAECESTREADMKQHLDKAIMACPPSNDEYMISRCYCTLLSQRSRFK